MKQLTLTLVGIILSNLTFAQDSLQNLEIVRCFTEALIIQSDSAITKCLPNQKDILYFTKIAKEFNPDRALPDSDTIINKMTRGARKNYNRVIEKGKLDSIIWDSIIIKNVRLEKMLPEFNKVDRANIFITYSSGNQIFVIKLTNCLRIDEKWIMTDRFIYIRHKE